MEYQARLMRRKDRQTDEAEARRLLARAEYGVLATAGADGLPYATPLSYVLLEDSLYFHCAHTGQKIENMAACPEVCFCAVGSTQPVYEGDFSTRYESALAFGRAQPVEAPGEKTRALRALCEKYLPGHMDKADAEIGASLEKTAVYRIDIQYVTGKARR